jgi:predicted transcriptional regulator
MTGEFDLPRKDVVKRMTPAQEFVARVDNGTITPREAAAITRAKLAIAINDLIQGNVTKVSAWLDQVAERNPSEALQRMMELVEFVQPRLKAAQVIANLTPSSDGQEKLRNMSMEELQSALTEGS